MLSRCIILITSFCLLGVTVVPGALIPCCCKSAIKIRAEHQRAGIEVGGCSHVPKSCCSHAPKSSSPHIPKSCCSHDGTGTMPIKTVNNNCGTCRCLEQLQIVALSGYDTSISFVRMLSLNSVAAEITGIFSPENNSGILCRVTGPRTTSIGLQTCSLRC
jgi:hypothetical protein